MANIPVEIIQLPPADPITGDEDVPAWQAGKTVRIKASDLKPINSVNGITPNNTGDIIIAGIDIPLDTTQFSGILNTSHSNAQLALDALDNAVALVGGSPPWGGITGNISNQHDLINTLNVKLDVSVSSVFIQTSQMNNYALSNHSHSQYLTTAAQSNHSHSDYLTTAMVSNAGSNFVNTSQSSLLQQTSDMTNYQAKGNYLTTAMVSNAGSNFVNTIQSSRFQLTADMSAYLTAGYTTHNHTQYQLINNMSNYEQASHTTVFQQTSQMSLYAVKSRIDGGTP